MKQYLLLSSLLVSLTLCTFSQPLASNDESIWEAPIEDIMDSFVAANHVKAIKAEEYRVVPGGAIKEDGSEELFEFDSNGHLVRQVEIERFDTSSVRDYYYTEKGALNWEIYEDKAWDKRYKSGYRLNRDKTIFQVKSYEVLNEDASMLLDTRQYQYTEDGKPKTILSLENNSIIEARHFSYDPSGKLVKETILGPEDNPVQDISYEYGTDDVAEEGKKGRP